MKRVKAKAPGFYGGARRDPGDVFDIPDEMDLASWMESDVDEPDLGTTDDTSEADKGSAGVPAKKASSRKKSAAKKATAGNA